MIGEQKMNILSVEKIAKAYGEKVLFQELSFGMDEGDKIGLIGVNGTGKSTLLKVLAGKEEPDQGQVVHGSEVTIEYLPQNPDFDNEETVIGQIFTGNSPIVKLLREYEEIVEQLRQHPEDEELQKKMLTMSEKMDENNAWQLESEAKSILTKLGISNFYDKIGILSGGQRKRVALAGALIRPSKLLILDEPTNHIDNETIGWLEEYLKGRKGALLMITHDRYFLDRVVGRILELNKGKIYTYSGNYSDYLTMKAEREEQLQIADHKRKVRLRNELEWIRSGVQGRGTKQKARIQRYEALKEEQDYVLEDKLDISVGKRRLGKKIIELTEVSHSYGDQTLIQDFSYTVLRGDQIGIIGPNGAGKSTLLNIIAGVFLPDKGLVETGETVEIGYYTQENEHMDEQLRVIEYIREKAEYITTSDGSTISASQMLERFLFTGDIQWTPIYKLSGGEKRRLYLLGILMSSPNVLLLDEPTNDLDIETLTILEEYIDEFNGPVITVSHDRYFLDKIAEKIFAFKEDGMIQNYPGNYSDYTQRTEGEKKDLVTKEKKKTQKQVLNTEKKKIRMTYQEKKEFEEIEDKINDVEEELNAVNGKINEAGSDFVLLQELTQKQEELENKLEIMLDRWAYLQELSEKI